MLPLPAIALRIQIGANISPQVWEEPRKGTGCQPRRAGRRKVRFYGLVARYRRRICRALPRGLAADQMRRGRNHDCYCGTARVGAHIFLHCSTTQVVIISASTGDTSSRSEGSLSFVIDDAAKTLTFADGGSLAVTRLDGRWISQITMTFFTNSIAKAAR